MVALGRAEVEPAIPNMSARYEDYGAEAEKYRFLIHIDCLL